jgi:N-acyl-D-aspartate/D-glutamate deacylase
MRSRRFDTVIRNGTIVDGLRTPRYQSDIGIRDGHIAYIGRIDQPGDATVIEAKGLIVAPGIIDLHTHYDSQIFWDPYCTISGWHGVTSVVVGNCGFGFAPCRPPERDRAMLIMARNEAVPLETMKAGMPWDWESFPEFMDSLDRTPKGVNVMSYVPLSPLLMYVMGLDSAKSRPATEDERKELRRLFHLALDAGACGFSAQHTGPDNVQRDYDGTPMITDVMDRRDLLLFAEILRERQEGFIQVACPPDVAEQLAEVSGRPVIWNALCAEADQHGAQGLAYRDVIRWLDEANARGNRVFAQALTCSVGFMFTMEDWNLFDSSPLWRAATLGSVEHRLLRLSQPETREALRAEYDAGKGPGAGGDLAEENSLGFVGIDSIFVIGTKLDHNKQYEGDTVGEYATKLGKHPVDAFLDLIIEEQLKTEFQTPEIKVNTPAMSEVVRAAVSLPGLSDGGAHTKFITNATYGTDFIVDHVRTHQVIDLEEAHWRLSTYSAQAAGLKGRGSLREGEAADIIVYDFDALASLPIETAHDFPAGEWRRIRRAEGYRYILVNGVVTFADGECTGETPGHLLRHGHEAGYALAAE